MVYASRMVILERNRQFRLKMGLLRRALRRQNYGTKSVTSSGVAVKSKAERIIADYFSKNNLSYQYEPTVRTKPFKLITGTIKPDFLLPNYGVYVEFWGLINSSTGKDYARTMRWKMAQYHRMGIKFISLYPNDLEDLDAAFRYKFKKVTGFDLSTKPSVIGTTPSPEFRQRLVTSRPVGVTVLGATQIAVSLLLLLPSLILVTLLGTTAFVLAILSILSLTSAIALFSGKNSGRILMMASAVANIISIVGIPWSLIVLRYLTRPGVIAYFKQPIRRV